MASLLIKVIIPVISYNAESDQRGNNRKIYEDVLSESDSENNESAVYRSLSTEKLLTIQVSKQNSKYYLNDQTKEMIVFFLEKCFQNIARYLINEHFKECVSKQSRKAWVNKG